VLVGVPAARLARVPVVAARRDLAHHISRGHRLALRLMLGGAQRVLANAGTVAAQAAQEDGVPASRLAIVPNGVDLERFDALASPPADLGPGPNILVVARMNHPVKGHGDLVETAARVMRVRPDARFHIAGDGPCEADVRARVAAVGVEPVINFLGSRTDIPALLAAADIVHHPARAEGMPNAVIEAMAAGRPIVATAVGGVPEILAHGHTGLLVRPGDPDGAAAALLALLADPARAERMGRAARALIEAEHTTARLVERTAGVYQGLLSASP
jgi:glycosyltransferase involved in cell wall biosynthesis